jgi:hypothetical protein
MLSMVSKFRFLNFPDHGAISFRNRGSCITRKIAGTARRVLAQGFLFTAVGLTLNSWATRTKGTLNSEFSNLIAWDRIRPLR